MDSPVNSPGKSAVRGSQWCPLATTSRSNRRVSPRWVVSSQPPSGEVRGVHHAVLELDPVAQAERVGVRVEVVLDLGVVREVGVVLGHREVLEGQPVLAGVDVQRAVGAAVAVGIAERPVAADPVGGLEAGVGHAVVAEHLAAGQAADAGADHGGRGALEGWHMPTLGTNLTRVNFRSSSREASCPIESRWWSGARRGSGRPAHGPWRTTGAPWWWPTSARARTSSAT